MTPSLDDWLPQHHARTRHARRSSVPPDVLWQAARQARVADARTLRPLIGMALPGPAPGPGTTFAELFRTGIFTLLEEGRHHSVSGVAGRLWTARDDYARFETAADYMEYAEPGTAKVVLLTQVRAVDGGSEILSESRVWCADRRARLRFRPFWAFVGPFNRFIGSELLSAVVRRAESARQP